MGRLGATEIVVLIFIGGIIYFAFKQNKNNINIDVLNKHYLQSQIKSSGTAYLLWFFFGFHYAYLGKWGIQILYWITFGGLGIWAIIDLFTLSGRVASHNALIFQQIDTIDRKERDAEQARNMAMILAAKGN
ncbi:TM2 domain-containing protein [Flavobacterium soyangense]|uniref:TM2 domain-containing protein n=1 Tax=Flavobacterium soyangense TaxID=2023265 RepID=UPI001E4B909A|nr:TM2 domain-containing protein [Flavobacterium soyangense]